VEYYVTVICQWTWKGSSEGDSQREAEVLHSGAGDRLSRTGYITEESRTVYLERVDLG